MLFLRDDDFAQPKKHGEIEALLAAAAARPEGTLHEHEVYRLLAAVGIGTPAWHYHEISAPTDALAKELPHAGPFVAKAVIRGTTHKTELRGIAFNVAADKAADVVAHFREKFASHPLEGILVAEQIAHDRDLAGEMLFGFYQDPFFGPCVALGFGGTAAEHYKSIMRPHAAQLFMPAGVDFASVDHIFRNSPIVEFAEGRVRGTKRLLSYDEIVGALTALDRKSVV